MKHYCFLLRPLALALLVLSTLQPSAGQAFDVHTTAPVHLTLPVAAQQAPLQLFIRGEGGTWQPLEAQVRDGVMDLHLDPAKFGGANFTIMLNPDPQLVLDDYEAPLVVGIKLDGRPLKITPQVQLGQTIDPPGMFRVGYKERHNQIDQPIRALLDGAMIPAEVEMVSPREAVVTVSLPIMEYGQHELKIIATDTSPQRNQVTTTLSFSYHDPNNLAVAATGARVSVSSSFEGYDNIIVINDGISDLPGDTCGSDMTWASAEVRDDHWVMITFPKTEEIREVTVYWAAYTHGALSPQTFEVQIPDGDDWQSVYRSPAEGEVSSPVITARFEPVKTDRFRVWMPAGQGPVSRPNLLWIAEIQAR